MKEAIVTTPYSGSSKTAPRILIFTIAMGADYPFYVKFIATFALTVFGYIISVLSSVGTKNSLSSMNATLILHIKCLASAKNYLASA